MEKDFEILDHAADLKQAFAAVNDIISLKEGVRAMRKSLILAISLLSVLVLLIGVGAVACGGNGDENGTPPPGDGNGAPSDGFEMELTSADFQDGGTIPADYTCDGQDISPALSWDGAPEETQSFALIVEDADSPGGDFAHWVFFNIPAYIIGLEAAVPDTSQFDNGARQGENGFGSIGYSGPCPPPDEPHHYHFSIYALDTTLELAAGATKAEMLDAMQGHILAQAEIVAVYEH